MKRLLRISCVAVAAVTLLNPTPAHALRMIIEYYDDILPVGMLSKNGRQVVIQDEGEVADWTPGRRTEVLVTVYQEETGAFAMSIHHSPVPGDVNDFPERVVLDIVTQAVGPNRFVEGMAEAMYVEQEFQGDELIREWSRTRDVLLLYEP